MLGVFSCFSKMYESLKSLNKAWIWIKDILCLFWKWHCQSEPRSLWSAIILYKDVIVYLILLKIYCGEWVGIAKFKCMWVVKRTLIRILKLINILNERSYWQSCSYGCLISSIVFIWNFIINATCLSFTMFLRVKKLKLSVDLGRYHCTIRIIRDLWPSHIVINW